MMEIEGLIVVVGRVLSPINECLGDFPHGEVRLVFGVIIVEKVQICGIQRLVLPPLAFV